MFIVSSPLSGTEQKLSMFSIARHHAHFQLLKTNETSNDLLKPASKSLLFFHLYTQAVSLQYKADLFCSGFFTPYLKVCVLLHPRKDRNVLTRYSHFQISSDSAYKIRRRTFSRSTRSSFMSVNVQKQHFIQHDLTELWRKLCHKLQASSKKLFCMDKILQ